MKKIISCLLVCLFLLTSCQSLAAPSFAMTTDEYENKLYNTSPITEETGLYYIMVDTYEDKLTVSVSFKEPVSPDEFTECCTTYCELTKNVLGDDASNLFYLMVSLSNDDETVFIWTTYDLKSGYLSDYRSEESKITELTIDNGQITVEDPFDFRPDKFTTYLSENNVTLTATDVQYNMTNNVNKYFSLSGYAKLSDYYNYGFDDDIEDDYFCMSVTPQDGSYSDSWYIYCSRSSFEQLFDELKSGTTYVHAVCIIPTNNYKSGQGNMAKGYYICY